MLMAQLRGKVAGEVWLGSEDLLTSAVLGTLKLLQHVGGEVRNWTWTSSGPSTGGWWPG